jgi:two-component system, NtrC family, nitrogen regulation response regulator NtrX
MADHTRNNAAAEVVVADDESTFRQPFGSMLRGRGYRVTETGSVDELLDIARTRPVDLVTLDLSWFGDDAAGLRIMKQLLECDPLVPIVMITGNATVDTAVEATRLGAYDYIDKMADREKILLVVRNAVESGRNRRGIQRARESNLRQYELVGASKGMAEVRTAIANFGPSDVPVLIEGDTGTGKELVAQQLHLKSRRHLKQLMVIGGGELSRDLGQDTLVGHTKGAFSGGAADRGGFILSADGSTLFLDDISDIAPDIQSMLLRFLETGDFMKLGSDTRLTADVRIVAATNQHIPDLIAQGKFRPDLYYRLKVATITIPPLRDRREDIPLLVDHFARKQSVKLFGREVAFTSEAIDLLIRRDWPGNVRELKNTVTFILLKSSGADAIGVAEVAGSLSDSEQSAPNVIVTLKDMEAGFRRDCIIRALNACEGNVSKAAHLLGIDRSHLYRLISEYDLMQYTRQLSN